MTPRPAPRLLLAIGMAATCAAQPAQAHDEPSDVLERLSAGYNSLSPAARGGHALTLGEYAGILGDFDAAERWAVEALALGEEPTAVRMLEAAVAHDRGRHEVARAKLYEVLSLAPSHPPALRLRARTWAASRAPERAAEDLRAYAAAVQRPAPEIWIECAEYERAASPEDPAAGIAVLEEAVLRLGPAPDLVVRLARMEAAAGRVEPALARLAGLPPALHATGRVAWERALILLAAGQDLEARVALTEALDALDALPAERRLAPATAELESAVKSRLAATLAARPEED